MSVVFSMLYVVRLTYLSFSSTYFGKEQEVTCNTEVDSHRAEIDTNHWMLTMFVPGSDVLEVESPEKDNAACDPVCQPPCPEGIPDPRNQ